MPVAFHGSATHYVNTGGSTSSTVAYNVGAGADRLLLVQTGGSAITSAITYAGAALTAIGSQTGTLRTWRKTAPAANSNNLVFSVSTYSALFANIASFTGVDQTTPLGSQVTNTNSGAVATTGTVTVPANGAAWGGMLSTFATTGTVTINSGTMASWTQVSGAVKAGGYRLTTGTIAWNLPSSPTSDSQAFPINGTVPPVTLTGDAALTSIDSNGTFFSVASSLIGSALLDDLLVAGTSGLAPGVITSPVFKNKSGSILASTSIAKVVVLRVSDMALVLSLINQTTNPSGIMSITDAALTPGVKYLVLCSNADATAFGVEPMTAV